MNQNSKPKSANMKRQALKFQSFSKFRTLLIVLITMFISLETSEGKNILQRGSSLSVEASLDVLTSPDKTFTCGFYGDPGENAYWFSIWFTYSLNQTVVWTANRDRPVYYKGSKVSLQRNGVMVLRDVDGTVIWTTNTTSTGADRAELLDTGNLVLKSREGKILWQSFDFPTDTLLPKQPFVKRQKLISKSGRGTFASGYFSLYFSDENLLKLIYDADDITSVYWPNPDKNVFENGRTIYNSSAIAVFDEIGNFLSSDRLQFSAMDMGSEIQRRLTLDYDGNLRLYSLNNSTGKWNISWIALSDPCKVHGVCGRNGICFCTSEAPKCSCPPGYEETEPGNWNKGCKPKFNKTCSNSQQMKFIQVPQLDFWGYDLNYSTSDSEDTCMKLCLDDCRCEAYNYRLTGEGRCYTKRMLFNGRSSPAVDSSVYIKVPANFGTPEPTNPNVTNHMCQESRVTVEAIMYQSPGQKVKWVYLYVFASIIGVIEVLFLVSGWWLLFGRHGMPSLVEGGYRALSSQFRGFSYGELKKATKNFKEELGRGASGAVYKGVLEDGRAVAVKRLGDIYQGEEVFWSEMSTIGRIYHMNLVRMWGFCSEGRHRLLVYEYVENQSLDKHLFSSARCLGWKERYKVALGTAKGLAYLHHECLEWVIHCDVKPENILLDSEFEPKIADFGLAKLAQRGKNSPQFSRIRGTKGYMAPEWAMNLPITAKVDVYSYGVVILELVKGIRLSHLMVEDDEEEEPELTRYVRIVKRKIQSGEEIWEDLVDPRLNGKFNKNQIATMVEIGISCVEEDRNKRPTMDSVVQTLLECEAEIVNL